MSMPHCDTRSYPRQYVPVFARPHTPSYRPSMDMRSLLKALMALRDENAYALEERSGVPQATINRFLTGKMLRRALTSGSTQANSCTR